MEASSQLVIHAAARHLFQCGSKNCVQTSALTGGTNRSAQFPDQPFEYPGASGDTTKGIGRIARTYFNSRDQLVTLAFAGGPTAAFPGATYTGSVSGKSMSGSYKTGQGGGKWSAHKS